MKNLQKYVIPSLGLTAATLILMIGLIGSPGASMAELIGYLVVGGVISLAMAGAALAWLRRGRGPIWLQMTVTYAVGVAVSLINILLTVQAMLLNHSDLPLLMLLLLFAGVISLLLGASLAQAIGRRVSALNSGARALAEGDLAVRVQSEGSDELAELAVEFNCMAAQLAAAAEERAHQEAVRRDLVVAVSHDLRTPLASLRASVEALADGLVDDPAMTQRYYETMRGQIGVLSLLIEDLFELSRLEAGAGVLNLQPVALSDLISDTITGLRPQAVGQGIELRGEPAGAAIACADPQQIERVLYNLGANAIRHTAPGGVITFRVLADSANFWQIEVCDSGEGIDPADLPHIFERFYRGEKSRSRATGGSGLGLAIARSIVEAHGGRIWAESQREVGTIIRFTLPAESATASV